MKIYNNDKNVFEASLERIEFAFDNFENLCVSYSGGKDSTVMIQLVEMIAKKKNKKYDVLFIDMEAQYLMTIEHIKTLKNKLKFIRDFYWVCLPLSLRNAVSVFEPRWICWEKSKKEKWEKNKKDLENYFRNTNQSKYSKYGDIVKLLFEKIINKNIEDENEKFNTNHIRVIDDGDWQGTQIFIIHKDSYQPTVEEYVYTNTYYGSCSGCDTLLAISNYDDGLPSENQIQDYMILALHLLQRCKYMQYED